MSQQQQQTQIKKKQILFRNPVTGDIISSVEVPKYIKLTNSQACDVQPLRSRLKMLYVDVLCRGYHPVKGFQGAARNVFKRQIFEDDEKSLNKTINLIAIANNEAVGTIWRCLSRQIGKPIKNYNMRQVQKQLLNEIRNIKQQCILKQLDIHTRLNQKSKIKYLQYQQNLISLQNDIKKQMNKIIQRCNQQQNQNKQTNKHIINAMGQQIKKLEKDIFLKSLIGIKQCQQNTQLVQYVMEQSYPHIKMSRKKAIEKLGQEIFNQKWNKYKLLIATYDLDGEVLMVCHRCLSPINHFARYAGCNDQRATLNVGNTILTDPYVYCRQVINENCWQRDSRKYIHPYLIYYVLGDNEKVPVCNRYFCNKCQGFQHDLSHSGECGFCVGACECSRCQGMDLLTKMMAVYVDSGGELRSISDVFFMNFDSKLLQTKNKRNLKSSGEREQEFREYMSIFYEQKIFLKRKDLANFSKILYFSQRIQKDSRQKYEKYKMVKQKLAQSKLDQRQRQRKQHQQNIRVQKLNNIIDGKKQKTQKEQTSDKRQKQNGKKSHNKKNLIQDQNQQCDIYYDDSDS